MLQRLELKGPGGSHCQVKMMPEQEIRWLRCCAAEICEGVSFCPGQPGASPVTDDRAGS